MKTVLDMKNICKVYDPDGRAPVPALEHITMSVYSGEYVAIMGPSGSGKSTLMNIIGCLDLPTSGEYLFDGTDVLKSDDDELSRIRNNSIGFVFQNFNLMPRETALENVALPLLYAGVSRKERLERAGEALALVGLGDRAEFLPTQLSGGQKQRVAIARAMVNHPQLLLADEPTGALDSVSGALVMDLFEKLHRDGVTIIMITHAQEIADQAERLIRIFDGKIS